LYPAEAVDLNRVETAYPREKTIAQFFEEQAVRTPERTAVIAGEARLSYQELDARANQLAHYLQGRGVGPDVLAGISMARSAEMLIAMLAILKAGGAYVPLDPEYPAERIAFVMSDACAPLLLTSGRVRERLGAAAISGQIVCVDAEAASIAALPLTRPDSTASGANLAYVIYTSGSTGKPKGVMVEHRNVANFFTGMDSAIGLDPGVWLAVTSISFDISALELLWTLARGFTVVIHCSEGVQSIPSEIIAHGVTHLQSTPSLARLLALDDRSLASLRTLRMLLLGGEALPASLVARLRECFSGEILNMYGPTETTIWSSTHRVREIGATIPIGRAIANTHLYVLNSHMEPVPQGETGELFIGGEGVVRGYWNRPELTRERFLPDALRGEGRIYRTGDIARFLPDGTLEFLGRADFQVKIRGFRIELGEIEAALENEPSVEQAVVVAREDRPGDQRLVAYIVARPSGAASAGALREMLASKLPEYMIPSHFVFIEKFPLTANGKIDRKALPAAYALASETQAEPPAPGAAEIERTIAKVWADALGTPRVELNDNFFDLGAHSLMVPEVHMQLQQALGREMSLLDLFHFPTVALLARRLRGEEHPRAQSTIKGSDRAQRRLDARRNRES